MIWEDQRNLGNSSTNNSLIKQNSSENKLSSSKLIPAKDWMFNSDGTITLTSNKIDRQLVNQDYQNPACQ